MVALLIANPLLLLFMVAGIGYLIGRIRIGGASLGIAAVLFVGLAFGALDPRMRLPDIVYQLGLVMFVYTVGLSGGADFVQSLRRRGARDMLLVVGVLVFAALMCIGIATALGFAPELAAGLFAGSLTNTPALAGVIEAVNSRGAEAQVAALPVVGYSIAYPVGVIGMILALFILRRVFRVSPEGETARLKQFGVKTESVHVETIRVTQPPASQMTIAEMGAKHHWDVVFGRVKRDGHMMLADGDLTLAQDDLVTVVGDSDAIHQAVRYIGEPAKEHLELERSEFDFRRVFVSNPDIAGRRLSDLHLREQYGALITRVRRGDFDLAAHGDTTLQLGDRVRVLTLRDRIETVSHFFGDSYRHLSEVDVLSLSLGIALGLLIGLIPIPLPGGLTFRLGIAGGPLIVALILGAIQRTGPIVWNIPFSANLTLRQAGLVMFLAGIGTQAGYAFVSTLQQGGGVQILLAGALITCVAALLAIVIAYRILKMPFGLVAGLLSGLQTQPALLGFAIEQEGNDVPNAGYAAVFPVAMISKIILAQVVLGVVAAMR
jgi:putative transport protein